MTKKEEHQELHILTPFPAIFFTAHQLFLLRNQPQTKGSCYIHSWIRQESLKEINSIFSPVSELNPRAWQRFSSDNSSSPLKCFIKSQKDSISPGSSPLERHHWSRESEVFPGELLEQLDTSSQHLQPTFSASGVPKLNPKILYSPGDLLLFFYSQIKPGFIWEV